MCEAYLGTKGWVQCPLEPGLCRKPSKMVKGQYLKLSVCVDDNLISGPKKDELQIQIQAILERFPGWVIEPGRQGDFEIWDLPGANWWYCRKRGVSKLVMCNYITKLAEKYEVTIKGP